MKKLILLLLVFPFAIHAQYQPPCQTCECLLERARTERKKENFEVAIQKYNAAKVCDRSKAIAIDEEILEVFKEINDLRLKAIQSQKEAWRAEREATQYAIIARNEKRKAERQTRMAVANDLLYKAQRMLEDGDRGGAFQLAAFTHKFIDPDNFRASKVLSDAYYCNLNQEEKEKQISWSRNLIGHAGSVLTCAFSPDGKLAATGSSDKTIKLWDVEKGIEVQALKGHIGAINDLEISPDGKFLVSGSADKTVIIWDLQKGEELHILRGHGNVVRSVDISPDGQWVISGSTDATIKLWNTQTGDLEHIFENENYGVNNVEFFQNGKSLISASTDRQIKIWNLETKEVQILPIDMKSQTLYCLAGSPDGKKIVFAGSATEISVWDLEAQKEKFVLHGHNSTVYSLQFSKDGKYLVSSSWDESAKLWDFRRGIEIRSFNGHSNDVDQAVFSPDGKYVLTGSWDKTARIWKIEDHTFQGVFEPHKRINWMDRMNKTAFSPDGKTLLIGGNNESVELVDAVSGEVLRTFQHSEKGEGGVLAVAFSPDEKVVATGGENNELKVWNVENGNLLFSSKKQHFDNVLEVFFSNDGQHLYSFGQDRMVLKWNIQEKKLVKTIRLTNYPRCIAMTPDEKYFAVGSNANSIEVIEAETGKIVRTFEGHILSVSTIAISKSGKYLVSGGRDKITKLWDFESGREIKSFEGNTTSVLSVAISPDEKYILTGSEVARFKNKAHHERNQSTVILWDVVTGKEIKRLPGHFNRISDLAFSPNGLQVATIDDRIRLFELFPNRLIQMQQGQFALGGLPIEMISQFDLFETLSNIPGATEKFLTTSDESFLHTFGMSLFLDVAHNNNPTTYNAFFEMAEKCYQQAINLSDNSIYAEHLSNLYLTWSKNLLRNKAYEFAEKKCDLSHRMNPSSNSLIHFFEIANEQEKEFDIGKIQFLKNRKDVRESGDYFFSKRKYKLAKSFYQKLDNVDSEFLLLSRLAQISEHLKEPFDSTQFLDLSLSGEILKAADHFYFQKNWKLSEALYQKLPKNNLALSTLFKINEVANELGKESDFDQFLALKNQNEILSAGDHFYSKGNYELAEKLFLKLENDSTLNQADMLIRMAKLAEIQKKEIDIEKFLQLKNVYDSKKIGDFFFNKGDYKNAKKMYENISAKERIAWEHINLDKCYTELGEEYPFQNFLDLKNERDLISAGNYFFNKKEWNKAERLYFRMETPEKNGEVLFNMYQIALVQDKEFDISQFLKLDDEYQLERMLQLLFRDMMRSNASTTLDFDLLYQLRDKYLEATEGKSIIFNYSSTVNSFGWNELKKGNFENCEHAMRIGISLDDEYLYYYTNLPPALLLQGKFEEAKKEFEKWKDKDFSIDTRYDKFKDVFLADFQVLESEGVVPEKYKEDLEKIKTLLKSN